METIENLRKENVELKKALSVLMDRTLIKKLSDALERVNSGEYITEEEFFKGSHR